MAVAGEETQERKGGFFRRLWSWLESVSNANDETEASLLERRVARLEQRLREIDR